MPSADEKPVAQHSHPAKSSEVCQEIAGAGAGPVILLVEPLTERTSLLRTALHRTTGWRVIHAHSAHEALIVMRTFRAQVKVVLLTTGKNRDWASPLICRLKEYASLASLAHPSFIVLSLVAQNPNVILGFEKLGAYYLLRAYSEQIVEVVRKLQWQFRTDKGLPTIALERRSGHVAAVSMRQGPVEVPIIVGPRLRRTIEYFVLHSRTEHTTDMIADALGVCRQSVKEYMLRLRRALDHACMNGSFAWEGRDILWTRRIEGGFVHGIRANVEINDAPEVGYSDILDDSMRIERAREVADVPNHH